MKARVGQKGPWKVLNWHHGIFGRKIPSSLSKVSRIWLFLCGITLLAIWIERNDLTFNNNKWDEKKMEGDILQSLWNYVGIAWGKALKDSKNVSTYDEVIAKFNMVGGRG